MLDFLGVTENWSAIQNIPWTQRWIFSNDSTLEPVSLDGITFTGRVHLEGKPEPVELDIQKSAVAEESNILIVSCIGLPEGRHPYEIYSVSESGNQNRLISGYIGVIKTIGKLADNSKTYAARTLSVRLPGDIARQIRLEWNSCTIASISAEDALNAARQTHTDAKAASSAATAATTAANTATDRANEANGYAGSAYSLKVAAGNSAAAAATSASNAANDAKTASDAKTAMDGLASAFQGDVTTARRTISADRDSAVAVVQVKQADAVLAVGRAQKTATDNVAAAQGVAATAVETAQTEAVQAVQTVQVEAVGAISPLVEQAEAAKDAIDQSVGRINTAEDNAGRSAQTASDAATAAQQALAAIPHVDAGGNMTLAGGLSTTATINANGGINIAAAVSPRLNGAVSNHELLDFMVDRIVRTAPLVTRISGLDLAAFYQASLSNVGLVTTPSCGSVRLNGNTAPRFESKAVFRGNGLIFALTQDGPHYYQPHVTVISAPTLLRLAYRTSPGAVVQLKLTDPDGSRFYGVRLVNDGGVGHYELFYKTRTGAEVVAARMAESSGMPSYTGNTAPSLKLNSLVIYGQPGFTEADSTVVRFGALKMVTPFSLHSTADLEFYTRQGSVNTAYYGTGFGVSVASIHQIALGYNDQLVPNLDNNSYKS